jgi:hypothetical protein
MTTSLSQLTISEPSLVSDELRFEALKFVDEEIASHRDGAELLNQMAGIYPGDPTGSLQLQAYIMSTIAAILEKVDWQLAIDEFEELMPVVEVTYG